MRKAAIALAVGSVLVLGLLAIGPKLVDLDRYRPQVAERISEMLGRRVTLAGPVDLSLLPNPHVAAHDVRVTSEPGAETSESMQVREVDAQLALWPLILGRLDVTSARLIQPVVTIDTRPRGNGAGQAVPSGDGAAHGSIFDSRAGIALGSRSNVRIAEIAVEGGTLIFHRGGLQEAAEHVNMRVSGDLLSGPLQLEGSFTTQGATLSIRADIERFDQERMPVFLRLAAAGVGSAELTGDLVRASDGPQLKGKLVLTGADFGALATLAGMGPVPPMLRRPLQLSSVITASTRAVAFDGLTLDLGDIHGVGAMEAKFGSPFALALRFRMNAFDLDRFLAERTQGTRPPAPTPEQDQVALPRQLGHGDALHYSFPPDLSLHVDFGVDAVLWRQGVVRQLKLTAALEDGRLSVAHLGAQLPGGSDFAVSGTVETIAGLPRFSGAINGSADNLRDLLRWSGITVAGVPPDRLRGAKLASTLEAEANTIEVRSIDMVLDAAHLSGAATIVLRDRVAIGARLTIDQLNLDAYFRNVEGTAGADAAGANARQPTAGTIQVTVPGVLSQALMSVDANLDASVDTLIWQGEPIHALRFAGTLQNRDLTIRELSVGDLGGASGKLSGYVQALGSAEPQSEVALDLHGPEFGRVLRLVAPKIARADTFGEFSLGLELKRELGRLTIDGDLDAMGGKLHLAGSAPRADTWDMTLSLQHPSFNRLVRLVLPNYRPQGGELGAVRLDAGLEWGPARVELSDIALRIADMSVAGNLHVDIGSPPVLIGNLLLGDLALDRFLPARLAASLVPSAPGVMLAQNGSGIPRIVVERWSHSPFDLGFMKLLDAQLTLGGRSLAWGRWRLGTPRAKLNLRNATLQVTELSGELFGGTLVASATVNAEDTPALDLKLQLNQADFAQVLSRSGSSRIHGKLDLQSILHLTGSSPADLVAHASGTAQLHGQDGSIEGINLPAIDQRIAAIKGLGDLGGLLRAGSTGDTGFSQLDGDFTIKDGVAHSDDLHLVADGGEGTGTLTLDLLGWALTSRNQIRLTGIPDAPPLGLNLQGPLDQPNWSLDIAALSKVLGERLLDHALQPGSDQSSAAGQPSDPASSPPPQRLKPKDILRNLLRRGQAE